QYNRKTRSLKFSVSARGTDGSAAGEVLIQAGSGGRKFEPRNTGTRQGRILTTDGCLNQRELFKLCRYARAGDILHLLFVAQAAVEEAQGDPRRTRAGDST